MPNALPIVIYSNKRAFTLDAVYNDGKIPRTVIIVQGLNAQNALTEEVHSRLYPFSMSLQLWAPDNYWCLIKSLARRHPELDPGSRSV